MQLIINTTTLEMWTYFWTVKRIPIWVGIHLVSCLFSSCPTKRYIVGTHMPTLYCDMHLVTHVNRVTKDYMKEIRVKLSLCTPWWYKGWAEVSHHLFSTSATDGSKRSVSNFHHFIPRERAPGIRKLGQPQRWFGHFEEEKISCHGRDWTPLLSSL